MLSNYKYKIDSKALQNNDSQPVTYTITTKSYNMEDVLHKLFTQLYNDDLLFDLVVDCAASEVDITFTTLEPEVKVARVLSGYNLTPDNLFQ